jgi:hypothetical protein
MGCSEVDVNEDDAAFDEDDEAEGSVEDNDD